MTFDHLPRRDVIQADKEEFTLAAVTAGNYLAIEGFLRIEQARNALTERENAVGDRLQHYRNIQQSVPDDFRGEMAAIKRLSGIVGDALNAMHQRGDIAPRGFTDHHTSYGVLGHVVLSEEHWTAMFFVAQIMLPSQAGGDFCMVDYLHAVDCLFYVMHTEYSEHYWHQGQHTTEYCRGYMETIRVMCESMDPDEKALYDISPVPDCCYEPPQYERIQREPVLRRVGGQPVMTEG